MTQGSRAYIRQIKEFPNSSGIYFVYSDDSLLYVGQAKNIKRRLGTHHRRKFFEEAENLRIEWEDVPIRYLEVAERYYIQELQPKWNRQQMNRRVRHSDPNLSHDEMLKMIDTGLAELVKMFFPEVMNEQ